MISFLSVFSQKLLFELLFELPFGLLFEPLPLLPVWPVPRSASGLSPASAALHPYPPTSVYGND